MKTSTLLTALFLLAAPLPQVLRAYAEDPASILARAKVSTGGLDGIVESWEDVRTGRF